MKRKPYYAIKPIIAGLFVSVIGIILWAIPFPKLFQYEQNIAAAILIFMGVLTMIFGDPK